MTKKQAKMWFLRGFHCSGEGFNGEYPFSRPDRLRPNQQAVAQETLDKEFDNFWATEVCPKKKS